MSAGQATPEATRPRIPVFGRVGILIAVLVLLYYGITGSVRIYVDAKVDRSKGRPVPDFTLRDRDGRVWSKERLLGKTTVLNFFRSRCPNCLKERDAIARLSRDADPQRLQVLGVMTDEVVGIPPEVTGKTLARLGYRHPILMADQVLVDEFHGAGWAHVTPITYIVDAEGRITHALRGHQTLESLRSATQ